MRSFVRRWLPRAARSVLWGDREQFIKPEDL